MTQIHTIILVNCIILLLTASDTTAAQETTIAPTPTETTTVAAPTTTSESSNETAYYDDMTGDRVVRIVSAECVNGAVASVLESDLPRTVAATAPTSSTSTGATVGDLVRKPIPPGRTAVRIDSPESRVIPVASYSVENGQYAEIRFDSGGSALIASPPTGTDMRDAATGGVLGMSFGTLLIVVQRRFGLHHGMERTA